MELSFLQQPLLEDCQTRAQRAKRFVDRWGMLLPIGLCLAMGILNPRIKDWQFRKEYPALSADLAQQAGRAGLPEACKSSKIYRWIFGSTPGGLADLEAQTGCGQLVAQPTAPGWEYLDRSNGRRFAL